MGSSAAYCCGLWGHPELAVHGRCETPAAGGDDACPCCHPTPATLRAAAVRTRALRLGVTQDPRWFQLDALIEILSSNSCCCRRCCCCLHMVAAPSQPRCINLVLGCAAFFLPKFCLHAAHAARCMRCSCAPPARWPMWRSRGERGDLAPRQAHAESNEGM